MAGEQDKKNLIALNVTRTRVTVLGFNLTVIALMLSMMAQGGTTDSFGDKAHLVSSAALFVGFCLTVLGLFWLLSSQNLDAEGLSHPFKFALGAITTYLALSHTIIAFMHEYLLRFESAVEATRLGAAGSTQSQVRFEAFQDTGLPILIVMASGIWVLTTYVAPLFTSLKARVRGGRGWILVGYYFALQVPIHWVYAMAWRLQYVPADQPTNELSLFALQFLQPLLWFR